MTQKDYTTQVLTPEPGHFLTQTADVPLRERVVTDQPIYLAAQDAPDNWREIPVAEAEEYLNAQREEREADIPQEVRQIIMEREQRNTDQSDIADGERE